MWPPGSPRYSAYTFLSSGFSWLLRMAFASSSPYRAAARRAFRSVKLRTLAGCVGYATYSMGLFNTHIEGLTEAAGSTGSNPLNVVLNVIPSNIVTAFGSNGAVLSSVFLAVAEHECAG